jgi:hypothetical protein
LTGLALRNVHLSGAVLEEFLEALPPDELTELHLHDCGLGAEGAARLAACPALSDLRTLSISREVWGDAGLASLAASPHLTRLTTLRLNRVCDGRDGAAPLTATGIRALASSPTAWRLRWLDLKGNHLQDDECEPLCEATALGQLTTLEISWGTVRWDSASEAMLRRLGSSPTLPHLSLAFLEGKWVALDRGSVREFPRGISPLPPFDDWSPWETNLHGG